MKYQKKYMNQVYVQCSATYFWQSKSRLPSWCQSLAATWGHQFPATAATWERWNQPCQVSKQVCCNLDIGETCIQVDRRTPPFKLSYVDFGVHPLEVMKGGLLKLGEARGWKGTTKKKKRTDESTLNILDLDMKLICVGYLHLGLTTCPLKKWMDGKIPRYSSILKYTPQTKRYIKNHCI